MNAVFYIRNNITGAYIHKSLFKIAEFYTHAEAVAFIRRNRLNRGIYYIEPIPVERR